MKKYVLINHETGEVYTITASTCQELYKRAESYRRLCILYQFTQDRLTLIACDAIEYTSNATIYRNARTLQEWAGGHSDIKAIQQGRGYGIRKAFK